MEEHEPYEEEEYEEDLFDVEEISNIIKYNIEQIHLARGISAYRQSRSF